MGKILIIQGADFSKYKVESIKIPYNGPVEIPEISIDSETLLCTLIANENLDIFYTTDGGSSWLPTKKGVTFAPDQLDLLEEAIQAARQEFMAEE